MAIYRRVCDKPFTKATNDLLRDPLVTSVAKVVLWCIASHRSDYKLTMVQLVAQIHEGRDAVRRALKELERLGYLARVTRRGERGAVSHTDFFIVDDPSAGLATDFQATVMSSDDATSSQVATGDWISGDGVSGDGGTPPKKTISKKTVLEDQENSPLPPEPASGPTPRQRGWDGKERSTKAAKPGAIDQHDLAAAAYVASNPPETGGTFKRLTDAELERLTGTVAKQFRAGITRSQINTAIGERNLEGANSIIAALISRINKLEPAPVKPQRQQVPECGQCQSRWVPVLDSEGHERWAPCPRCSPQAMAKAAA